MNNDLYRSSEIPASATPSQSANLPAFIFCGAGKSRNNVTSIKPRFAWVHSLLNPNRRLRSFVQHTLPTSVRTGTTQFLRLINRGEAPAIDASIREKFTAQYETDISELEALINWDLSHWRINPAPPMQSII